MKRCNDWMLSTLTLGHWDMCYNLLTMFTTTPFVSWRRSFLSPCFRKLKRPMKSNNLTFPHLRLHGVRARTRASIRKMLHQTHVGKPSLRCHKSWPVAATRKISSPTVEHAKSTGQSTVPCNVWRHIWYHMTCHWISLPKSLWQEKTYFTEPTLFCTVKAVHQPDGTIDLAKAHDFTTLLANPAMTNASPIEVPTNEPDSDPPQEPAPVTVASRTTTRSGWSTEQLIIMIPTITNYDGTHKWDYQNLHPLLLYKATTNPFILYPNEALAAPDKHKIVKAMIKDCWMWILLTYVEFT